LGTPLGSGLTSIMRFVGTDAPPLNVRSSQVTDGTYRTIFAVDAGPDVAVPWTKPDDLPFISGDPASVLGDIGSALIAAYFDGHISMSPSTISASELRALITHRSNDNAAASLPAASPLTIPLGIPTAAPLVSINEEEEAELPPLLAAFAALTEDDLLVLARREEGEEEPYYLSVEEREVAESPADVTLPQLAIW
jgi:hypothetical protein